MSRYLVISRMRVAHANAMQAWWLMAPPSPMTLYGFAHNMGLRCHFSFSKLAMVHHGIQWLALEKPSARFEKKPEGGQEDKNWDVRFWNHKVIPQQPQGATFIDGNDHISSGFAKGLQPTARCHVEMSMVLDIGEVPINVDDIETFLWSGRLGGGAIVEHGFVGICDSLEAVTSKIGGGFWVLDRSDMVSSTMKSLGLDGTEALIRIFEDHAQQRFVYDHATEIQREKMEKPASWLSANVTGYATLEPFQRRFGVRDGVPHAYAEPLVGLTQYCSVREKECAPFWQYQPCPEKGVYLIKGN